MVRRRPVRRRTGTPAPAHGYVCRPGDCDARAGIVPDPLYAARLNAESIVLEVFSSLFKTFCDASVLLFWLIYLDRLGRVRRTTAPRPASS